MGDTRQKALLLLLVVGLSAHQGVLSQDPTPPVYRLPSTITPQLYSLRLEPDLDTGVIRGSIRIQVNTTSDETQTLDSITMHMGTDVIVNETTAAIISMDGTIREIGAVISDDANTLLVLELPEGQTLNHSQIYEIRLHFQSVLNTDSKGLFTGYFNSTSKYVASNFRPTFARDVFPCFDEPQFKTPVALQVLRPTSYYVISSAPSSGSSKASGHMMLETFVNTDPISIHSLGLFMGQQPPVESMGVTVVVPPSVPTNVSYLETLISTITAQMGPPSHSPLYLIVLPDRTHISFSSYGFVFTSPEVYEGEVGSPLQWTSLKLQLTEEFLRQYLEYIKTPQWWSELWLSESIGAFLSLTVHQYQSEPWLRDWVKIVVRSEALGSYTSPSGPVILGSDLTKWDIENHISNQTVKVKGLSTLLMWEETMPKGLVLETIMDFIRLRQTVVTTSDLVNLMVDNIEADTSYNATPAIPLLPNWLTQPGSPLVRFTIDSSSTYTVDQGIPCSSGSPTLALRSISVALAEGSTPDWNNTLQGNWLVSASSQFTSDNISQWSVINIETAPYRVKYSDFQYPLLLQALSSGWAPDAVASALQDDAVAFSLGGCLNFSIALSVLNNSQHSVLDWWPVAKAAEAITANIGDDPYGISAFGIYFASLFTADLLNELDLRNSASHPELSVARELVTPWLCRFNISTCREAVVELGGPLWQGNSSGIAGSDLENVACYGARYTPGALTPLLDAYQSAESVVLRRYFTIALSCLTEQDSVMELLNITVSSNSTQAILSEADARQILTGLASTLENSQTVMNFILSQSTDLQAKFGVNALSSVIKNLAKNRVNLTQLSSLQSDEDLDPYVVQSASEAIANSNLSQTWYEDYSNQLYQDLPAGNVPGSSTIAPSTTTTPETGSTSTPATGTTSTPVPPGPTTSPGTTSTPVGPTSSPGTTSTPATGTTTTPATGTTTTPTTGTTSTPVPGPTTSPGTTSTPVGPTTSAGTTSTPAISTTSTPATGTTSTPATGTTSKPATGTTSTPATGTTSTPATTPTASPTTTPTTTTTNTASTSGPSTSGPSTSEPSTSAPTPPASGASALSDSRVLTVTLTSLLVILASTLQ